MLGKAIPGIAYALEGAAFMPGGGGSEKELDIKTDDGFTALPSVTAWALGFAHFKDSDWPLITIILNNCSAAFSASPRFEYSMNAHFEAVTR